MSLCGFSEIRPLVATQSTSSSSSPVATASQTPSPSASSPLTYATGTCSFHLQEYQTCDDNSKNLFAIVNMKDNNKNDIGNTNTSPFGDPINVSNPYSFNSKLPKPLVIVGEHQDDYVQFTYGDLRWTSRSTSGPATCSVGGWNPKSGPVCAFKHNPEPAVRFGLAPLPAFAIVCASSVYEWLIHSWKNQMDCSFPC